MNREEFIEYVDKLGIKLTNSQLEKFDIYLNYLLEYNKTTNLTAIRNESGVYLKHFYDSLLVCKYYKFDKINNMLDVGSGAGFPGMILKIIYPNINLTLIDSNNKKTTFLKELTKKLELENVQIINNRAENFAKTHRHYFDVTIARAVSELRIISELCLPMTKVNGTFIAMKGKYDEELLNAQSTLKVLNSKIVKIYDDELPIEKSFRSFIFISPIKEISENYPRLYEHIVKKILK